MKEKTELQILDDVAVDGLDKNPSRHERGIRQGKRRAQAQRLYEEVDELIENPPE